jgi:hypothetical protein
MIKKCANKESFELGSVGAISRRDREDVDKDGLCIQGTDGKP